MRSFRSFHNLVIVMAGYARRGTRTRDSLNRPPGRLRSRHGLVGRLHGGRSVAHRGRRHGRSPRNLASAIRRIGVATVLATYDAIMLRFILFVMGVHATILAGVVGMLQDVPGPFRLFR